jgi:hypothetical protein
MSSGISRLIDLTVTGLFHSPGSDNRTLRAKLQISRPKNVQVLQVGRRVKAKRELAEKTLNRLFALGSNEGKWAIKGIRRSGKYSLSPNRLFNIRPNSSAPHELRRV